MTPHLRAEATANAKRYSKTKTLTTEKTFGYGQEGFVFQTNKQTAVKAFYYSQHYRQELEIYQYLQRHRITEVSGFHIPQLIGNSDQLKIIEMEVVSPPFIVDFVGAQIDIPIEREDDWIEQMKEIFEDDWQQVKVAIWQLGEKEGIYLSDTHPGNIRCR